MEVPLYNKEIKQWYMDSMNVQAVSVKNIRNYFLKAAKMEELYGKDLCDWNLREITSFMKMYGTSSATVIYNCINVYKNYTNFCINHNIVRDFTNHYEEVTETMFKNSVNQAQISLTFISRENLLNAISNFDSNADKFAILCCFEGLYGPSGQALIHAHTEDIDGNTMKLYDGRIVEISDELRNYAFLGAEETSRGSHQGKKTYNLALNTEDPTLIIKPRARLDHLTSASLRERVRILSKGVGYVGMTPKKIAYSGAAIYIDRECKKYNVPAEYFLTTEDFRKDFENQYSAYSYTTFREYLAYYEEYLKQ